MACRWSDSARTHSAPRSDRAADRRAQSATRRCSLADSVGGGQVRPRVGQVVALQAPAARRRPRDRPSWPWVLSCTSRAVDLIDLGRDGQHAARLDEIGKADVAGFFERDDAVGKVFAGAESARRRPRSWPASISTPGMTGKPRKVVGQILFGQRQALDGRDLHARLNSSTRSTNVKCMLRSEQPESKGRSWKRCSISA